MENWPVVFFLKQEFGGAMKSWLAAVAAVFGLLAAACDVRSPEQQLREKQSNQAQQSQSLIDMMMYFKDTRPDPPVCYAYFWQGVGHGGPALATVPCQAVEHLLVNK